MNAAIGFNTRTNQVTIMLGELIFDCVNASAHDLHSVVVVHVDIDTLRPEVAQTLATIAQEKYKKPALVETRKELFNGSERVVHADVFMVANTLLGLVIE